MGKHKEKENKNKVDKYKVYLLVNLFIKCTLKIISVSNSACLNGKKLIHENTSTVAS